MDKKSHFPRRQQQALLPGTLAAWLLPLALSAQTYPVLNERLFEVGTAWQFDTVVDGAPNYSTTWELLRREPAGGRDTLLLREILTRMYPGDPTAIQVDDRNMYLTPAFWMENRQLVTRFNPLAGFRQTFSDPVEKVPRSVSVTDSARLIGHGQAIVESLEDPFARYLRVQDQYLTFLSTQTVSVPAGSFECVVFRVTETSWFDTEWTETAQRDYSMNRVVGPVAMEFRVTLRDEYNRIVSDDTVAHRLRFVAPNYPDLVLSPGATFAPDQLQTGQDLTLAWRESCRFRDIETTHTTTVYLTADTTVSPDDVRLVDAKPIPPIGVNQFADVIETVAVPPGVPEGTYHIALVLDDRHAIEELDENNTYVLDGEVVIEALPDLTVADSSFAPRVLVPGEALTVRVSLANLGGATAPPVWTHVYLSTDAVIDASDYPLVMGIRVPELAPFARHTFDATSFVPLGFEERAYSVGVVVDVLDEAGESNEGNNAVALAQPLFVGRPDLRIDHLDFGPRVVDGGDPIGLAGFIFNPTQTPTTGSCWIEFFLSPHTDFSPPRWFLCDSVRLPPLEPGGRFPLATLQRTVYVDVAPGRYTVGVVVDRLQEVTESNETNNTAWVAGHRLFVGQRPTEAKHWHFYH